MLNAVGVTVRFGKRTLFEDVNIKFTEGNCYGLIGANGAGKSTFLKILSGELDTTKGDIVITPGEHNFARMAKLAGMRHGCRTPAVRSHRSIYIP